MTATRRFGLVTTVVALSALLLSIGAPAQVPPMQKGGMVCSPGGPEFNLVANRGYIQTPDGNSILMWSYANQAVDSGHFQTPGPVLCVNQGAHVIVHLHNTLPEPASIVFPGQEGVLAAGGGAGVFTREAAALNGDVTYEFDASSPGTYIYESGSDPTKQLEMGLYGALIVRPAGNPDRAYGDSATQFNPEKEYLILLNEIDPDLHHAVETGGAYDFTKLHNRYFAVNGREFPDTIQDNGVPWLPNQPYGALVRMQPYCNPGNPSDPLNPPTCTAGSTANNLPALIRVINVGELNHPFHPHGNHLREIAQDGRPFGANATSERFGETVGSGQTQDYLFSWTDQDFWDSASTPFPGGAANFNYRNVTFKDANTWSSGSAYLGKKGTLPTGTVSQNICGEWYFPMHSHALNEFSNFDEGFGGMATLLRIDPRGGCVASPTATTIQTGTLASGTFAALAAADTSYYKVNSTTTNPTTTNWYAQFSGVPGGATNLKVTYQGNDVLAPTVGPTYTQNFTAPALVSTGTSSSLPAGWSLAETGTGANTSYTANNGGSATGDTYSYGAATGPTTSDRALGSLRTASLASTFGAQFTNTTGGAIVSLAINYRGERWRKGQTGTTNDRLDFQYSLNGTSWANVDALDFTSPTTTGAAGAVNGNAATQSSTITGSITGLSIPNGAQYFIRWVDFDRTAGNGADDGLSVDSFNLTPSYTGGTVDTSVYIYNWATSSWVQIAPLPAGSTTPVGAADVIVADNVLVAPAPVAGSWASYIGTSGRVRVRVLSTDTSTTFVTGGNLMKLVYDAP
jgi:Multicopper oxidase